MISIKYKFSRSTLVYFVWSYFMVSNELRVIDPTSRESADRRLSQAARLIIMVIVFQNKRSSIEWNSKD